jgi:outer membrane protein
MAFRAVIGLDLGSDVEFVGDFRQNSVLDLDELGPLMDEALLKRPELLQLNYRRGQQEAQVSLEKSGQRPELSLVASAQSQFQSDRLDLTDREWRKNWATGFLLRVPLFDGRRASARVAQAKASTRQVELEWQRVERMVRLDVEQNWLRWREVNARMGAQEDAVRQAEKGLQMAESLFKTGAGTQLEVLNAQLALVQSRTGLALARRDRSMSLVSLEKAVGVLSDVGSSK